ncbi:MAG: DUF3618 domain-containing protein [Pseudomonadota bacterium]|jgi:ElaB/YqjD/DUF883 family membrane-anchored ribosome-binding protein
MTRTAAELERDVEEARSRLDGTLEALKHKLEPQELFHEAKSMMSEASNKALSTAVEQVRANPLPIALIGVGVAWLALSQARRRHAGADGYYPVYEGYDEGDGASSKIRAKADAAKARLSEGAGKAREKLSEVQHQAADGVARARSRAGEVAHSARAKAGEYGHAARQRFDDTLENEPLVVGAIGLAVGAAIGAALPSTPAERRYFAPARRAAAERAKESLSEVREAAQRAYGQAKDELRRQASAHPDDEAQPAH